MSEQPKDPDVLKELWELGKELVQAYLRGELQIGVSQGSGGEAAHGSYRPSPPRPD